VSAPKRRTPQKKRAVARGKRRAQRLGVAPQLIALLLVVGLAGAMAIQPTRQLLEQRDRISEMSGDLTRVNKSNRELTGRIERLNNPDYLEETARENGYARPGETVYNVVPPSRKELRREKQRVPKERPAHEPAPGFMERFLNFVGLG